MLMVVWDTPAGQVPVGMVADCTLAQAEAEAVAVDPAKSKKIMVKLQRS